MKLRLNSKLWFQATALSCLILVSMSLSAWGSTTADRTISSVGSIGGNGKTATLLFSTNFDFLPSGWSLSGNGYFPGWSRAFHYIAVDGNNNITWAETGRSGIPLRRGAGTKVLGQQSMGRNELDIYPQYLKPGIQKIYVTTWLYYEPTYQLTGSNFWHEVANPIQNAATGGTPKMKIHFYKHLGTGLYDIKMMYQGGFAYLPGGIYNIQLQNMPIGRWFQFRWFVDRVSGTVKAWIYDRDTLTKICDVSGYDLGYASYPTGPGYGWYTTPSKIYYGANSQSFDQLMKIWSDGFEIWDDIPAA